MNRGKQHMEEELLVRFIIGETSERESAMVLEWIDRADENRSQFEKLKKVWSITADLSSPIPAEVDIDQAWIKVKSRIDQYSDIQKKHTASGRSLTFYLTRVAAVFILGIIIFAIYRYQSGQVEQVQLVSADSTITDSPLPDGSLISLNQGTTIEYPEKFSSNERRVKLNGEAFFEVEPDTVRPFIIEAHEAIITVLGTSFNVKALGNEDAVEVLVEEGLVQLSNPDLTQSEKLSVGEKGIYIKETNEVKKETDIDVESLYWLNKTLLFRDTDLSIVFETLERLYNVDIQTENSQILDCQLTAKFSNETIDHIIEHISIIFEFEIEKDANTFLIKGDGCQ